VVDQVLRSFLMALVTVTAIFVLFMVMGEATRQGLAPLDTLRIVPYIIPSSLPFTIPVALLFSVSVVYGRMASDNEIVAIKTAGISAVTVLIPTWVLGLGLTAGLWYSSNDAIPRATHAFRNILLQDFEDLFYKQLKKDGQFDNPGTPFFVSVREVDGRILKDAIFKHRKSKEEPNIFDFVVASKHARVKFDVAAGLVRVLMDDAETTGEMSKRFLISINGQTELQYPLPKDQKFQFEKRIQEMTNDELSEQQVVLEKKISRERLRQAVAATMWIASGRIERVKWPEVGQAYKEFPFWKKRNDEFETEKYFRAALAGGTICFVWLGAPVGILLARRDFLSSFILCFLPIILAYYPVMLLGVNLAKEGAATPWIIFGGNAALLLIGTIVVRKVRRH
jgi:lipopolysaccharide export system permease protein